LVLLETDGKLIAQAGYWLESALSHLLTKTKSSGWFSPNGVTAQDNFRFYPVVVPAQPLSVLVVYGPPAGAAEQALQGGLQVLLAPESEQLSDDSPNNGDDLNQLHRLAETISIAMNPDVIPQLVLEESQRVFQAHAGVEVGAILLHDPLSLDNEKWEIKASFGTANSVSGLVEVMRAQIEHLLEHGRPATITNFTVQPQLEQQLPYSAVLWAPLKTARRVLGGILLGRLQGQPAFTPKDEKLLAALALQSALALEKAQWLAQADEKLNQKLQELKESNIRLATLQHINAVIHGSMPLHRLLRVVVENIRYGLDYPGVFICLPDEQRQELTIGAAGGSLDRFLQRRSDTPTRRISFSYHNLQNPLVNAFMQRHFQESEAEPWLQGLRTANVPELADSLQEAGVAYGAAFPLWHYDQAETVIGILVVLKDSPGPFARDEQQLLSLVSSQVALAIHNAHLFRAEQQGRREMEALYQAGLAITSAQTTQEVLRTIIRQIVDLVGVEGCGIYRWEEDREVLATELFLDKHGDTWLERVPHGTTYALNKRPALQRVLTQQALACLQVDQPDTDPIELRWMTQGNFKTCLLLPLLVRDRSIGLLSLTESRWRREFSSHDIRMAQGLAAQAAVALENARLHQDKLSRIESELELAQRIQYNLLPQYTPQVPGLEIAARSLAARQVGGDFYRYLTFPDGRFGLAIGDVSGKGVPSALFMAMTLTAMDTQIHHRTTPDLLLTDLNQLLHPRMRLNRMNTGLLVATFEPSMGQMHIANAGMIAPLVVCEGRATWLDVAGLPIGVIPDTTYHGQKVVLGPEALLVFASDGIIEAMNRRGILFGFERLQHTIETLNKHDPHTVLEGVWEAVSQHIDDAPPHDDMTLIITRTKKRQ
jgi:serine phosphatase RsbU (regulator of sigma subunit)